jgi:threonine dehydrogenase-like Zn-dependent dehydrogenase
MQPASTASSPSAAGSPWEAGSSATSIDGCQAEYVIVPDANANLAPIPDGLGDEQVLCPDIMSTGMGAPKNGSATPSRSSPRARSACAPPGRPPQGAARILVVEGIEKRRSIAKEMGADVSSITARATGRDDPRAPGGRGVDAIEALGTPDDVRVVPARAASGGTLSSLGVYSGSSLCPWTPWPPVSRTRSSRRSVREGASACA